MREIYRPGLMAYRQSVMECEEMRTEWEEWHLPHVVWLLLLMMMELIDGASVHQRKGGPKKMLGVMRNG